MRVDVRTHLSVIILEENGREQANADFSRLAQCGITGYEYSKDLQNLSSCSRLIG